MKIETTFWSASAAMNYIYNLHQNEKAATLSEDFDKFAIKNTYSPMHSFKCCS